MVGYDAGYRLLERPGRPIDDRAGRGWTVVALRRRRRSSSSRRAFKALSPIAALVESFRWILALEMKKSAKN